MSKFKSYINSKARDENQNLSNDSTTSLPLRHITQVTIEANGDDDDNDDKPPMPPTRHPMVNRLTSSIDESLVNLTLLSQDAEIEQEQTLFDLEQIFFQFRTYIEKYYHQYEHDIKSTYLNYDQHLYELKLKLKQVREKIIQNFTSIQNNKNDNDDYIFDINKYRYLEMLTTQTLNQTMDVQKPLPKYRIKLNNLEQLREIFLIQCEPKSSSSTFEIDNDDLHEETTPTQRSMSIETSTSTNMTDDYDNVPKDNYGRYRVSYQNTVRTPLKSLERWSYPLDAGNYFIPLLTPYRQSSLLLYCLDRESFICYNSQSLSSLPTTIKWRGARPSAVYWFDEMNMLFVACRTHIYGCYLDENIHEDQRIQVRIPIEQTATWSDTQGQLCWPKFITCGNRIDRLLYAYWTDILNKHTIPSTSFIYYQIQGNHYSIKSQYLLDGRLRALHSTLSTYRLGLLIEQLQTQCTYLEIRTLEEFSLVAKFELRTTFERFRYGCCLTNLSLNSNSYMLCDHKQKQLWHVNGGTGDIKVKHVNESIYSVICLLNGTLAILLGSPMRFDFIHDPNDSGRITNDLFPEQESFEV
ncbi:unnamed protein product [Rotaria magnacalcarata]|uniref:Uncharacterized protein n=7 Tax=Rotaria magnacalcarata TaxID=392030 RepID=A0A816MMN7_9BILA|nr:unnamed protein product [Rotaria magnacalcarata]CAF1684236.1 unnamed protein product [Rotaria magnacalcarata]CAF1996624.1 unnamed protein product [Rotaria magnacalcarata]